MNIDVVSVVSTINIGKTTLVVILSLVLIHGRRAMFFVRYPGKPQSSILYTLYSIPHCSKHPKPESKSSSQGLTCCQTPKSLEIEPQAL